MRIPSKSVSVSLAMLAGLWLATTVARADTVLWIDDTSNNIGTVDLTTNTVSLIGNANNGDTLTDIGFTSSGSLYGVSFGSLYSINQSTGQATLTHSLGVGGGGMNALVGYGSGLLAASNATTSLYGLTPSPFGATTYTGSVGASSAGDLAPAGGFMYESAVDVATGDDELVKLALSGTSITSATVIGDFNQGATRFNGVFGLAGDGTTMYAVNGTTVYTVNLANAALATDFNYSGHKLSTANGTAFKNEATVVPEPGSLLLLGSALLGFGILSRRRRRRA